MITFLEECELKVFPYPYHKKREKFRDVYWLYPDYKTSK